jgi:hypothetical protein
MDDIPVLSPGGVVSEETMNELGLKPPSGAAHLTVKPGNDIKKGVYYEAVFDKKGNVIEHRQVTDPLMLEHLAEIGNTGEFLTAFEVLCDNGKRCPNCDEDDCETRVKPYAPSLLSRLRHRIGIWRRT